MVSTVLAVSSYSTFSTSLLVATVSLAISGLTIGSVKTIVIRNTAITAVTEDTVRTAVNATTVLNITSTITVTTIVTVIAVSMLTAVVHFKEKRDIIHI